MSKEAPLIDDFKSIVINNTPLMDARAPIEFTKGSFPYAINTPLMNDEERHQVGICYKKKGNENAVKLGHSLVNGKIKEGRVNACLEQLVKSPDSLLYCFRGGQRSAIMQEWISDRGITVPRLAGGYKAFRSYLMEQTLEIGCHSDILVLGGRTGSGKTILLNKLAQSIDLEGLANHRGSSFGRHASEQPSQIDFENALAYDIIQHHEKGFSSVIIEDESRNVGRCYIPHELFDHFSQSKVVVLDVDLQSRIDITYDEYVLASQKEYDLSFASGESHTWIDTMHHNFKRIYKRLGEVGYKELTALLDTAWSHQQSTGDPTKHKAWIEELLHRYYDPMYDYQIEQKSDRIIFRGDSDEVLEYFQGLS